MPLDLQIIRTNEFVRIGPTGHLDFEASKSALALLARACRKRGVHRAVLDIRELPIPAQPLFTPSELADLVQTFREAGFTREQRLAVLYRTDPHHGARMFAFISAMRGWQVRAFDDFEKALLWLSDDKNCEPGEQDVPVRNPQAQRGRKMRLRQGPISE